MPAPLPVPEDLVTALPERLRHRVVALVADALPALGTLPAPLRRVATFAPGRRARLGAGAIWSALADDDFRQAAATQVAPVVGSGAEARDPLDDAALAWLERGEGWEAVVGAALAELAEQADAHDRTALEVEQLRGQVGALQAELRDQRAEHRTALDEARSENTALRRKLGQARADLRAADEELATLRTAADEARAEARAAGERQEAEAKRVRALLEEAEAGAAASRRESRTERDAATLRARYLLDTLVDAASGLRRELALPAVEGSPGAQVEAGLAGTEAPRGTSAPLGREALEQLLAMPRARLVVDGYNVTKAVWENATLEAQRSRLVTALAPVVARTGAETTVVFDAAGQGARPVVPAPRGVRVVFSPVGVIADDVIRQLVAAEPVGRVVVVVTSDQAVARDVTRAGARAVPAAVLASLLGS